MREQRLHLEVFAAQFVIWARQRIAALVAQPTRIGPGVDRCRIRARAMRARNQNGVVAAVTLRCVILRHRYFRVSVGQPLVGQVLQLVHPMRRMLSLVAYP